MKQFIYKSLDDGKRHAAAVERVAALAHIRAEDVQPLYEQVLEEML